MKAFREISIVYFNYFKIINFKKLWENLIILKLLILRNFDKF